MQTLQQHLEVLLEKGEIDAIDASEHTFRLGEIKLDESMRSE
jgi:hypothetical protein